MPTALHVRQIDGKPGQVYYPLETKQYTAKQPGDNEVLIRITHCALNHRDLFIRQHLYPGIDFTVPLLSDACGTVVSTGASAKQWQGKRVIFNPGDGWDRDPAGPEDPRGYRILGGTKLNPAGAAVEEFVCDAGALEEAPEHLSSEEAAALPLAGLTAFRATMTKAGEVGKGKNVLVTGIGGGVAIMALLYAVAAGANVYVSSGKEEKIRKAVEMGAQGGVNYKEEKWEKKLVEMLPKERKTLDAIIDGAGGDIVEKGAKLLKPGGVIAVYGMTVGPKMPFLMSAVMRNIEVRGSTMGSRKEFADMVKFVKETKMRPIVSKVARGGLENINEIDKLFEEMNNGSQFGKLVLEVSTEGQKSKL